MKQTRVLLLMVNLMLLRTNHLVARKKIIKHVNGMSFIIIIDQNAENNADQIVTIDTESL